MNVVLVDVAFQIAYTKLENGHSIPQSNLCLINLDSKLEALGVMLTFYPDGVYFVMY